MPHAPAHPDANAKPAATGWGLIAGNGRFPFLVLEGARQQGIDMAVIAIKEEASPELAESAKRIHWVSLGELSKAIELMHEEGVTQAVMAGQVKHNKIFSSIRPDWKLAKLLFSLTTKNTDALIGGVAFSAAAGARRGRADKTCAKRTGSRGHRLRPWHRQENFRDGCRANDRSLGPGLRGS
jgi:hypothetical protein